MIKAILLILNVVVLLLLVGSTMAGRVAPSRFIWFSLLSYGYLYFLIINIVFVVLWLIMSSKWFLLSLAAIVVRYAFLPLYFQVGGTETVSDETLAEPDVLKVLTFNAHHFHGVSMEEGLTDSNMTVFLGIVDDEQPDIMALQEYIGHGDTVQLTERLKQRGYVNMTSGYDNGSMTGEVIFSKYPIARVVRIEGPSKLYVNLLWNGDTLRFYCLHLNSYGLDKKGEEIDFAELLRRVGEYGKASGKEFWVYYTAPHPRDMKDDVIEVMAQYDCLGKQIHIPIQSGDENMLQRMNRHHDLATYRHIIETIREKLPTATIFTDIIVGFTHETEEEFENTRKAMEEFKYNMAFIAQYSVRPGAVASEWDDDVPKEVKRERYHRLTEELMKHSLVYNQGLIGKTVKMLVETQDRKNGYLAGHTEGKIVIRFASRDTKLIGQIVNVKVTSASPLSIEGVLV